MSILVTGYGRGRPPEFRSLKMVGSGSLHPDIGTWDWSVPSTETKRPGISGSERTIAASGTSLMKRFVTLMILHCFRTTRLQPYNETGRTESGFVLMVYKMLMGMLYLSYI